MAAKYPLMRNNIAREDLDAVIAHLRQDDLVPCGEKPDSCMHADKSRASGN